MAKNEDDVPVILSTDEARAGVTGHHVRYVLAFGLAGSLIAFLAISLYFGYDALTQTLSNIFAVQGTFAQRVVFYAVPLALAAVATVLPLGLWNMVWGRSAKTSQTLMRWRVLLQFIAVCLVMAALFLSVKQ
jgi:Hypoxia induced protein conserved region